MEEEGEREEQRRKELEKWFPPNSRDIDNIFYDIINYMENNDIFLNQDINIIYNNFVYFIFNYSDINI